MPNRPLKMEEGRAESLTGDPLGFLGGGFDREDATVGFDFRLLDRLARFECDQARHLVSVLSEFPANALRRSTRS